MMSRALALTLTASCIAFADASPPAQELDAGSRPVSQTPTASPTSDPIAGRIKYLHDRLRITAEQEQLWESVAQAIRDSARDTAPLLKERFRATTSGSALDVLHSYESLGEVQLDSLKKFIASFDPLYDSLADNQRKIADAILREGPLDTMIVGIPELPAPFGSPLAQTWGGFGGPLFLYRLNAFQHFHALGGLGAHFGRLHR
jgi:periplasmic protein CpxP/Spy